MPAMSPLPPEIARTYHKRLRAHWAYMAEDRDKAAKVCREEGWIAESILYAEIARAYRIALRKLK